MQFSEMKNLLPEILRAVQDMNFLEATDIQIGAIPLCLEGKDVIGRSSTGTGKTAAFGIPVVQMVSQSAGEKSQVLILCPTRELAVQNSEQIRKFAKYLEKVGVAIVYGGQPMEGQIRELRTAQIVIGTPGRIMDHMRRKTLRLQNLKTVVLDEADEMLNMGFLEDIQTILSEAPEERQTILFSATMPPAILKITKDFQRDPVLIAVDKGQKTVDQISQYYYNIPQSDKIDTLKLLIEYHRPKRSLVFCNTKKMVDELCASLGESGFKCLALHGDLKQSQRNQVMRDFKSGSSNILIATDVAARGIDIDDVEAVFNYDIPQENEYYIHRIGRTGRAGKIGASHTLAASRSQVIKVREIEKFMGTKIEEAPVPTLEKIHSRYRERMAGDIKHLVEQNSGREWRELIEVLEKEGYDPRDIAASLCAKMSAKGKKLNAVKGFFGERQKAPGRTASPMGRSDRVWIHVDLGANDKIRPNAIVAAIAENTGLPISAVGKINIYGSYVNFEMSRDDAEIVLSEMASTKINHRVAHFTMAEKQKNNQSGKKSGYGRPARRPHFTRGK